MAWREAFNAPGDSHPIQEILGRPARVLPDKFTAADSVLRFTYLKPDGYNCRSPASRATLGIEKSDEPGVLAINGAEFEGAFSATAPAGPFYGTRNTEVNRCALVGVPTFRTRKAGQRTTRWIVLSSPSPILSNPRASGQCWTTSVTAGWSWGRAAGLAPVEYEGSRHQHNPRQVECLMSEFPRLPGD